MKNMHSTRPFEAVSNVGDLKLGCPGVVHEKLVCSMLPSPDFVAAYSSNEFFIEVSDSLACSQE